MTQEKAPTISEKVTKFMLNKHLTAKTEDDLSFVYCPVGDILSFHPEDVSHMYCPYCHIFFKHQDA